MNIMIKDGFIRGNCDETGCLGKMRERTTFISSSGNKMALVQCDVCKVIDEIYRD